MLLKSGADPCERDTSSWTPLHHAMDVGSSREVVLALLDKQIAWGQGQRRAQADRRKGAGAGAGAASDVSAVDPMGRTPLHVAVERARVGLVLLLL